MIFGLYYKVFNIRRYRRTFEQFNNLCLETQNELNATSGSTMHLLGSSWLRSEEVVVQKPSASTIDGELGLEDGSVNVLDNEGVYQLRSPAALCQ